MASRPRSAPPRLPVTEEAVIAFLRAHPGSRRAALAMHLGMDRKAVDPALDKLLQKLRQAGTIELTYPGGGYWRMAAGADSSEGGAPEAAPSTPPPAAINRPPGVVAGVSATPLLARCKSIATQLIRQIDLLSMPLCAAQQEGMSRAARTLVATLIAEMEADGEVPAASAGQVERRAVVILADLQRGAAPTRPMSWPAPEDDADREQANGAPAAPTVRLRCCQFHELGGDERHGCGGDALPRTAPRPRSPGGGEGADPGPT